MPFLSIFLSICFFFPCQFLHFILVIYFNFFDNPYKKNLQNRTSPPPFSPRLQPLACMSAPSWGATEAPLRARKTTFAPQPQPHCHATEPPLCGNGASVAMRREKVFRWDLRKVLFYKRLRTTLITQKFRAKIFFLTAKRFSRLFRHCFFDTKDRQIVNFKINSSYYIIGRPSWRSFWWLFQRNSV